MVATAPFPAARLRELRALRIALDASTTVDGDRLLLSTANANRSARGKVRDVHCCWSDGLRPALEELGIDFPRPDRLIDDQRAWLLGHFQREVFPVLTPIVLDPSHPFPFVPSGGTNVAALLDTSGSERPTRLAVVQVPAAIPWILRVPHAGDGRRFYVFLADVIRWQLRELFIGATIVDHTAFRVTRRADPQLGKDACGNLPAAIVQVLRRPRSGLAVGLEVESPVSERLRQELLAVLDLEERDLIACDGPVELSRLSQLADLETRP